MQCVEETGLITVRDGIAKGGDFLMNVELLSADQLL
jgi:hypothetical protein